MHKYQVGRNTPQYLYNLLTTYGLQYLTNIKDFKQYVVNSAVYKDMVMLSFILGLNKPQLGLGL